MGLSTSVSDKSMNVCFSESLYYVCICVCMSVYVCIHLCMYVCMYVCM